MKAVVFGASGEIGTRVAEDLRRRGAEVVAAQRSSGVDAYSGAGVADAVAGADVIIDATSVVTTSAKTAIDFFATVARTIAEAANAAGVKRVVCVSILNAADPAVNAKFGYYQGKAAQEAAYALHLDADRLVVVRSAQWFELAGQVLQRNSFGPVAAVPHMLCRPLAAADAATMIVDAALDDQPRDVELVGPADLDIVDMSKAIARQQGKPKWVLGIRFGGAAMRNGGLLPRANSGSTLRSAAITFDDWLAAGDRQVAK